MFTGIITDIGTVIDVTKAGDTTYRIQTSFDLSTVAMGASIAHSGVCLTVVEKGQNDTSHWYDVVVSEESLSKTNMRDWGIGTKINLERSLKLGDELGGHLVFGHVDAVTQLMSKTQEGDSWRLKIKIPEGFAQFVAAKGSVCLNGVSLTVNEVDADVFGINIIPHTWDVTTFGTLNVGDKINFEVDMLARYVSRMMDVKQQNEKAA